MIANIITTYLKDEKVKTSVNYNLTLELTALSL